MTCRAAAGGLALVITLAACGESESAREARAMKEATPQRVRPDGSIQLGDRDRAALGLVVAEAAEGDLPESTMRFGRALTPLANEGQVVSPVTGRIAAPPTLQIGASIQAGAKLLEVMPVLDTPDRISVGTQSAERDGQIAAAERELVRAEADAARARSLSPQIVSAAKLQEAETAVAVARARLEGLRNARTASAQAETRAVAVTAPISGTITTLNVTVGALVNKGDVLALILKPGPLWIDLSVPPDDPVGDRYNVSISTGTVAARLLARGTVTESDGTRHDRLVLNGRDAGSVRPGSSVVVHVARGVARGVIVPESTLVPGIESDTVFVETSPGIFAARPVRVATRFGGNVRLASGLKPGERVVTQGAMALQGETIRGQLRPAG